MLIYLYFFSSPTAHCVDKRRFFYSYSEVLMLFIPPEGRTSLATATCQQKCDTKKSWRRYFALAMKKFYGDNFFLATNFFSWRRKKILVFVYIFENNDHYFGEGAANFKKFLITSEWLFFNKHQKRSRTIKYINLF